MPKYILSLISTRRLPRSHVRLPLIPLSRRVPGLPRALPVPGHGASPPPTPGCGDGPAWEAGTAQGLKQSQEGRGFVLPVLSCAGWRMG